MFSSWLSYFCWAHDHLTYRTLSPHLQFLCMKKLLVSSILIVLAFGAFAQIDLNQIRNKTTRIKKDSLFNNLGTLIDPAFGKPLTQEEIIAGLKEALNVGAKNSTGRLSAVDGFFKDEALKILMPQETEKIVNNMRQLGMGKLVDDAILSMNRAAEDAVSNTGAIFTDAIRKMSIEDGVGILRGGDHAATDYLQVKTKDSLTRKFRPLVAASLAKVNATKYWKDFSSAYNRLSAKKLNPDLTAYVIERTLNGLFYSVGLEETKIRKDPAARVSALLKKVFAQ